MSSMSGPGLISSKVSELVVMGGYYPSGWEFNFGGEDPESTAYLVENWPNDVPITYSGGGLGGTSSPARTWQNTLHQVHPSLLRISVRESWDPLTTLYGILGLDGFESIEVKPPLAFANDYRYNSITSSNGSNAWVNDSSVTNQHYLRLANGVSYSSVAWLLDQFYIHDPIDERCFG